MRIPAVGLLALTILHTVSTITTTAASAQEERAAVGAILALDAAVQKRFEKVDRAHGFVPENDAELSSLRELEEANVRVVLYLGGRSMLGPGPDGRRAVTNRNTHLKSNAGACWHGQSEQSTAPA